MKIILYSTNCPKCTILKKKLNKKQIVYTEINNIELMQELGINQVPILDVGGKLYNFKQANDWVEAYNGN